MGMEEGPKEVVHFMLDRRASNAYLNRQLFRLYLALTKLSPGSFLCASIDLIHFNLEYVTFSK
jgi:hypothetical protein